MAWQLCFLHATCACCTTNVFDCCVDWLAPVPPSLSAVHLPGGYWTGVVDCRHHAGNSARVRARSQRRHSGSVPHELVHVVSIAKRVSWSALC
eukprot:351773-Chlamydomonas_euryale.AAC.2